MSVEKLMAGVRFATIPFSLLGAALAVNTALEHYWYGNCRDWWGAAHSDWRLYDDRRLNRQVRAARRARHGR